MTTGRRKIENVRSLKWKVLFLSATKLMIVSLSLSIVNIEKKKLSLSHVQNKDSSVARTSSHLVTSAVPAHL